MLWRDWVDVHFPLNLPCLHKISAQGCGNTMPDLSSQIPFHSRQVENFCLLVLKQVQMFKINTILHFIFWLFITSSHVALKTIWIQIIFRSQLIWIYTVYKRVDIWYHTVFKIVICLTPSKSRRVLAIGGKQRSFGLHMVCFEMVSYHNEPH